MRVINVIECLEVNDKPSLSETKPTVNITNHPDKRGYIRIVTGDGTYTISLAELKLAIKNIENI